MSPDRDDDEHLGRRRELRRDEDAVLYHRVSEIEHNVSALAAGPTLAQLDKLDLRYAPRAELMRTFATRDDLEREFLNRDQLRVEYVPRSEHRARFDWMRNVALLILTFAATVEPIVLRAH